jgi:hypothetical protein
MIENDHILHLPNVPKVEHVEPGRADPDAVSRENDRAAREAYARDAANMDAIPLQRAALLLGEHVSQFGGGPITHALVRAARAGELRLAGDLRRHDGLYGAKRNNPATTPVSREGLREWIETHGDAAMRCSPGAQWCGLIQATNADNVEE